VLIKTPMNAIMALRTDVDASCQVCFGIALSEAIATMHLARYQVMDSQACESLITGAPACTCPTRKSRFQSNIGCHRRGR
jgi:hypothetical protein